MAETYRSRKPLYWALVLAAFVALAVVTSIATRKTNQEIAQSAAAGDTVGTAYDPTTGAAVPAGAVRGGYNTGAVKPLGAPVPGPLAQGAEVPPAKLDQ